MKKILFLSILCVSFISFSQTLSDSLLLHYSFNGNMNDFSGNNYDGTGNATLTTDRFGNANSAYHFNGVDQYIDFPNMNQLKPTLPVSISFWVKFESEDNTDCTVFDTSHEDDMSAGIWLTTQSSTGRFSVAYGDGTSAYSSSTRQSYLSNSIVDTNIWHHITAVIVSDSDIKLYVDCEENGGAYGGSGGALAYSFLPGTIGRHDQFIGAPEYFFKGSVDDFRYYNRELTVNDIDTLCTREELSTKNNFNDDISFKLFPNPVNTVLNIDYNEVVSGDVIIQNVFGEIVYKRGLKSQINVESLSPGVYILTLKDEKSGYIKSMRFIKD